MLTRLLFAALVLLPLPAAAQAPAADPALSARPATFSAQMLAGSWALSVEGTVVVRTPDGSTHSIAASSSASRPARRERTRS